MRVYGNSPLYNYVELMFRSKRLFIVSVVLATAITVTVAITRAGTYTAVAIVLLANNGQSGVASMGSREDEESKRGSIKFKLNVLNVVMKDPAFMKTAFQEARLNKDKSEKDFDTFCKDATKAIVPSASEHILELSCRWKDQDASEILNAFYSAYSRRVLDLETSTSQAQTSTLTGLLEEYTHRVKAVENTVIAFKRKHLGDNLNTFESSNMVYIEMQRRVKDTEDSIKLAQAGQAEVTRQLDGTPQMIEERFIREGANSGPEYAAKVTMKTKLEADLADLQGKYTEKDPRILKTKEQLDKVTKDLAALDTASGKSPTKGGRIKSTQQAINPQWERLNSERTNIEMQVKSLETRLVNERDGVVKARQEAITAPELQIRFKWLTDDMALATSVRENVRGRLEQAKMHEKEDRDTKSKDLDIVVHPTSEPDQIGAKTMIFYAAGPILGLLIAFAFSLLSESMDHSLRTPLEVEKYLGKPVLAVLPRVEMPKETRRQLGSASSVRPTLPS